MSPAQGAVSSRLSSRSIQADVQSEPSTELSQNHTKRESVVWTNDLVRSMLELRAKHMWQSGSGMSLWSHVLSDLCKLFPATGEQLTMRDLEDQLGSIKARVHEYHCAVSYGKQASKPSFYDIVRDVQRQNPHVLESPNDSDNGDCKLDARCSHAAEPSNMFSSPEPPFLSDPCDTDSDYTSSLEGGDERSAQGKPHRYSARPLSSARKPLRKTPTDLWRRRLRPQDRRRATASSTTPRIPPATAASILQTAASDGEVGTGALNQCLSIFRSILPVPEQAKSYPNGTVLDDDESTADGSAESSSPPPVAPTLPARSKFTKPPSNGTSPTSPPVSPIRRRRRSRRPSTSLITASMQNITHCITAVTRVMEKRTDLQLARLQSRHEERMAMLAILHSNLGLLSDPALASERAALVKLVVDTVGEREDGE
ncbi:hypothetical protein RI367_004140 [Sorochytrium milnesiophthora]